jgi:hypothetical protein
VNGGGIPRSGILARRLVFALTSALVVFSGVALYLDGRLPAPVPADAPPLELRDLLEALTSVDAQGQVNLAELKAHHEALERYVAAMAKTAPSTDPARFPTAEDRVAYWLNAAQALVLVELLDARGADASQLSRRRTWPIGGQYLSRAAIEDRFLEASGDARVWLALFTGARGGGVPDGAPFDGASLNPQLDDAVRRFVQRRAVVQVEGATVRLSSLFREHEAELLAALPEGHKQVLQVVWAYLPESCGTTGCLTRADLDHACGAKFDRCEVTYVEPETTLAVTH